MNKDKTHISAETLKVYSEMTNRLLLAQKAGQSYGGMRNLYTALGYPDSIQYADYLEKYKRLDIAKAVVDRPIRVTWRGNVSVYDPEQKGDDADTLWKMWDSLYNDLKLKSKFIRLDKLSTLGRYGILVLGLSDVKNTSDDMKLPAIGKLKLKYVSPYGEDSAEIKSFVSDPKDPRYGLPLEYLIGIKTANGDDTQVIVHHSRVIHVTGDQLNSEVYGEPYLEAIYNRLMDVEKLVGGSAEMYWRGARPGYSGNISSDYEIDTLTKERIESQIEEYEHNLRRILINEGVDLKALQSQIADPAGHIEVQIAMISAITGIPQRILMGSEQAQLASDQDRNNWLDFIQTRREEYAELQILRPLIDRLMELNILPSISTYAIEWPNLFNVSSQQQAEVAIKRTNAINTYTNNSANASLIPPEMFLRHIMEFDDETIQEIITALSEYVEELDMPEELEKEDSTEMEDESDAIDPEEDELPGDDGKTKETVIKPSTKK